MNRDRSNSNPIFQHPMRSHDCDDRDIHEKYLAKGLGPRPHDPRYDIRDSKPVRK